MMDYVVMGWFDWLMFAVVFLPCLFMFSYFVAHVVKECYKGFVSGEDGDVLKIVVFVLLSVIVFILATHILETIQVI